MTDASRAVARLSGPGDVAAAVPSLVGFVPARSLVGIALRGPRRRVGLVARVDLPPPSLAPAVLEEVVAALAHDGASAVTVLVYSEAEGDLPHEDLADEVCRAVRAAGLRVEDVLLVRAGRWWSYLCSEERCCPPDGTPLPAHSPGLDRVAAEGALLGRAVLPDREALVRSLAAPTGAAAQEAAALLARLAPVPGDGDLEARRDAVAALQAVRDALRSAHEEPGRPLEPEAVARVALALGVVAVRDEVLSWTADRGPELLTLLQRVVPLVPPPWDAGPCACLAAVAYASGEGATAAVALERALATDPGHGLARLLDAALRTFVPPSEVEAVLVGAPRRVSASGAAPAGGRGRGRTGSGGRGGRAGR